MFNPAAIVIVDIPLSTLVRVAPDAKLTVVAAVPALIQDPACCKERPALTPVKELPSPLKLVAVITPALPSLIAVPTCYLAILS